MRNISIVSRAPGFKVIAVPVTLLLLMLASGFAVGSGDHASEQKATQGKDSKSDAGAKHDADCGDHADGHKDDHGKDSKSGAGAKHGAGG